MMDSKNLSNESKNEARKFGVGYRMLFGLILPHSKNKNCNFTKHYLFYLVTNQALLQIL